MQWRLNPRLQPTSGLITRSSHQRVSPPAALVWDTDQRISVLTSYGFAHFVAK